MEPGVVFGAWTLLGPAPMRGAHRAYACRCVCGVERAVLGSELRAGRSKSCGCQRPGRLAAGESGLNEALSQYRNAAKDRGHSWDLNKEEFRELVMQPCHYCGAPPARGVGLTPHARATVSGIDRRDSAMGYVSNNCVTCCKTCNYAKGARSYREFVDWIHWTSDFLKDRHREVHREA